MGTTCLPGEVRNPKGNPNPNIRNWPKTGPKTPEGKLKGLIKRNSLTPWSKSKTLNKFRKCDKCPLRERVVHRIVNGKTIQTSIPAKCPSYKAGQKCVIEQGDMIMKLDLYYKYGEEQNTLELQKHLTYSILEDAEIARETEIVKNRSPGFYTHKFKELASKNLESVNRIKYGERQNNTNLNVNVDLSKEIIEACKKAKEEEKDEI